MKDDPQLKTPLFDALVSLAKSRKTSFHTPGHKSGKGISTRFRKFVGPKIFSIDLTTLDEIDSLQQPRGVIKASQALAAEAYGAEHSFFLVNGTTGGNHAMILAACAPGARVLVARNAHRSVIAGLLFSGARPVFFSPEIRNDLKVQWNVSLQAVKKSVERYPEAKVLILTSPNYHGISADLPGIIRYAHEKGIVVLVDEAHGPHLHFHPDLPVSAMAAGADLSVQSTHKIIGGMTQASMLHARSGRVDIPALSSVLKLTQSTSPSYILMASLDLARMQMATEGRKLLDKAIHLAEEGRAKINQIPGLFCFGPDALLEHGAWAMDVTKLTISVENLGLTGFQVSHMLNCDYHIQVEMADTVHVLVIVSIGDRQEDLDHLVQSLWDISKQYAGGMEKRLFPHDLNPPPLPEKSVSPPREAFFQARTYVDLTDAAGKVASQIVTVYPPGIPVLIPGEVITTEIATYFKRILSVGATVDGLEEDRRIAVVEEDGIESQATH
ncbi:MAG: aminotransferase class I/II-fold pyridoxal phosphate-dependent enzyme [Nitrospiria bacterium]